MPAADWDKGTHWVVNASGDKLKHYTKDQFLTGQAFKDNPDTTFYIEAPHLQERLKRSVAQIYKRDELDILAKNAEANGCRIIAFPAKMTPRAREEFGHEKSEDAVAIRKFAEKHTEIGMMEWCIPTDHDKSVWARRDGIRREMSERLNIMRPAYEHTDVDRARDLLHRAYPHLSDNARKWFGMKLVYAGKPKERLDFKDTRVMSVYVAVFDADGNLRLNDRGSFAGVREIMALLWMHPYHGRGGTARSNLILHMLSKTETEHAGERARVPELRRSFISAIKELIRVFRDSEGD